MYKTEMSIHLFVCLSVTFGGVGWVGGAVKGDREGGQEGGGYWGVGISQMECLGGHTYFLPLDVDSINENDSVANPDPTPRIASVHKSRFAEVVLVECWMEAVYYCLLLRKR